MSKKIFPQEKVRTSGLLKTEEKEEKEFEPYFIHEIEIPETYNITTKYILKEEAKPKSVKCKICKTISPDISEFNKHAKSKHNLVNLCKICSIVLKDKESKMDHIEKNHEKEYGCPFCNKKFWQQKDLNLHIRNVHYDLKTERLRVDNIFEIIKKINHSSIKLKEEFFIHDIVKEEIKFFIKKEGKTKEKEQEKAEEIKEIIEEEKNEGKSEEKEEKEEKTEEKEEKEKGKMKEKDEKADDTVDITKTEVPTTEILTTKVPTTEDPTIEASTSKAESGIITRLKCKLCENEYEDNKSFNKHAKTHGYRVLCCFCSQVFFEKSTLEFHMMIKHDKTIFCRECGKKFWLQKSLDEHFTSVHNVLQKNNIKRIWT
ncbi:hypothetical protein RclHR1_10260002 [Rhizophagus clarus]|uniref:Zinc finger protein 271-like isoform X1 n=1 Tax=Rhizophagus clarus TaxID=94130 RepID=A0A2Z6QCY5_9GLOM|nr:hypothetical protein RclHR1_10260002 [Rhizophagus clarus]GET02824.1 zinc finger protein 271-like isoform X1 [Rhizophagus clarus]